MVVIALHELKPDDDLVALDAAGYRAFFKTSGDAYFEAPDAVDAGVWPEPRGYVLHRLTCPEPEHKAFKFVVMPKMYATSIAAQRAWWIGSRRIPCRICDVCAAGEN